MADTGGAKYTPINANGATFLTEMKTEFGHHLLNTKKTTLAYGFMFTFFALTFFLVAFTPSSSSSTSISSSLWFNNIFKSSLFPPFVANSTNKDSLHESNNSSTSGGQPHLHNGSQISNNGTQNAELQDTVGVLNPLDLTQISPPNTTKSFSQPSSGDVKNQTTSKDEILKPNPPPKPFLGVKNASTSAEKSIAVESAVKNVSSSLAKKQQQSNKTNSVVYTQQLERENLVKSLVNCDIFNGNWLRDESYPLYKPGSCSLIDEQFNCFLNGRPDTNYDRLRWKPKGCSLPRLDGRHMLDLLRGKRLVFVGDSLNRNMWESLVCILRNSVKDKKKVYEASGNVHFKTEASYSFVFEDYKFTVEFFATPFLVQEWEMKGKNGEKKETLRLDMLGESANNYKSADIIIFNTGHWWTHEKTSLGKDYYQEGSHVYDELNVLEAFRKALTTWGRWVDANINTQKSVVFFRGYSASHFSGGQWNSGGACDHEIEPIKNETYLSEYPPKMKVLERVLKGMKTQVSYMNITRMTDYRKDGHPSVYRKQILSEEDKRSPLLYQDCSHWCLPGVPDVWNEILYAQLLLREYEKQRQ